MSDSTILIVTLIGLVLLALVIPQMFIRSAGTQVVRILREHGATNETGAVLPLDVGLAPQPIWERALKRRDYKPKALGVFVQLGIVAQTDEGAVYLQEAKLEKTMWRDA